MISKLINIFAILRALGGCSVIQQKVDMRALGVLTAALLVACHAYGADPTADLTIQVVPAGGGGIACAIGPNYTGAIPAPAQQAGFTTCARNNDFTQTLPSNWLNCTFDHASAQWYFGHPQNIPGVNLPCSSVIFQTTDPLTGGKALDMQWLASYLNIIEPSPSAYYFKGSVVMETQSVDSQPPRTLGAGVYYPYAYYEMTFRVQPTPNTYASPFEPTGLNMAFWTFGSAGPGAQWTGGNFEFDFLEMDPGWFNASTVHQWFGTPTYQQSWSGAYPGDARQYHTWGALVTGDGQTNVEMCNYIDGNFLGCASRSYGAGSTEATDRYPIILGQGIDCSDGTSSCMPSDLQSLDMYITSIRVWSCANWQSTMCYTTPITPTHDIRDVVTH
jgi:hypothetical protein